MSDEGGTVRYHRAEYDEHRTYPWNVWFTAESKIWCQFTAAEGEEMGLTPPPPAIDFDALPNWTVLGYRHGRGCRIKVNGVWTSDGTNEAPALISENWTVLHVPAAAQPPSTADALHTLGLTERDTSCMTSSAIVVRVLERQAEAAREAVQR